MRLTPTLLGKLEDLLETAGYRVRYEKGSFRGGACLLQDQQLIVVNKFFPLEGRINTLLEVIAGLPLTAVTFHPEQNRLLEQVRAHLDQTKSRPASV